MYSCVMYMVYIGLIISVHCIHMYNVYVYIKVYKGFGVYVYVRFIQVCNEFTCTHIRGMYMLER